jgi:Mn2+/Fe2+ NRAMP family transporter
VLYSTVFIATASNGRLFADFFRLMRWIKADSETERQRVVRIACVSLPVLYFIMFVAFGSPVSLVTIGAVAQALMLPFLALAGLYFLYFQTNKELKPGPVWIGFLWVSVLLMTATGFYQLVTKLFGS